MDSQTLETSIAKRTAEIFSLYAISAFSALLLSAIIVEAVGANWSDVWNALLDGSLRKPGRWGGTLGSAVPMAMVAVGTVISNRVGLINIGQEGQMLVGAAFAAYVGTQLPGPGPIVIISVLLAGFVGGAFWSGLAGALRYWRNVPEVLTTLLLVTIAANLVGYALKHTWLLLDPTAAVGNRTQVSTQLEVDSRMPRIELFGNDFSFGVIIALALLFTITLVLSKTVIGFKLNVVGQNRRVGQRFGISDVRQGLMAMCASGGFAGLAGALMLTSGDFAKYRLVPGFTVNLGWTGLLVALVARDKVMAIIPVAFVFASLRTGSSFLAATGVERRVTDVVQGLLVLALLIPPAILFVRDRRRALARVESRT